MTKVRTPHRLDIDQSDASNLHLLPKALLAHNVPTRGDVDQVLAQAMESGSPYVSAGVDREWGGYTGYFADPDGFRWEVAWNPGEIGRLVLPQAE